MLGTFWAQNMKLESVSVQHNNNNNTEQQVYFKLSIAYKNSARNW